MNLPNRITLSRILLTPVMAAAYYIPLYRGFNFILAAVIFIIAACTDFIDGKVARATGAVSDLGKFLDPLADKILAATALFIIVESHTLPIIFGSLLCALILSRELMIGMLRQIAAAKGFILAADKWGKLKTVLTNIAIPLLFASKKDYTLPLLYDVLYYAGFSLFIAAALMTVLSGVNYLYKNRTLLK